MFLFDLGLAFGEWDINKLEVEMPRNLLIEWMGYFRMRPFPEVRADFREARQTTMIVNTMAKIWTKRSRKLRLKDMMPRWFYKPKKSPQSMYKMIRTLALAAGAKDPKKKE